MQYKIVERYSSFLSRTRRVSQIFIFVAGLIGLIAKQRLGRSESQPPELAEEQLRQLAVWTKAEFVRLGPTFIKLGQIISVRADLFPASVVKEFASLQDKVEGFSFEDARAVIETELGASLEELFASINEKPLAVASIGQIQWLLALTH